jgi:hypothetical protein
MMTVQLHKRAAEDLVGKTFEAKGATLRVVGPAFWIGSSHSYWVRIIQGTYYRPGGGGYEADYFVRGEEIPMSYDTVLKYVNKNLLPLEEAMKVSCRLQRKAADPSDNIKPMTWVVHHDDDKEEEAIAGFGESPQDLKGRVVEDEGGEQPEGGNEILIKVDPETHKVEVDFGGEEGDTEEMPKHIPKLKKPEEKLDGKKPTQEDSKEAEQDLNGADEADKVTY